MVLHKQQKRLLIRVLSVLIVTSIVVVAMINFKDMVNRAEAVRAMENLGLLVKEQRAEYGSVPSDIYVNQIIDS